MESAHPKSEARELVEEIIWTVFKSGVSAVEGLYKANLDASDYKCAYQNLLDQTTLLVRGISDKLAPSVPASAASHIKTRLVLYNQCAKNVVEIWSAKEQPTQSNTATVASVTGGRSPGDQRFLPPPPQLVCYGPPPPPAPQLSFYGPPPPQLGFYGTPPPPAPQLGFHGPPLHIPGAMPLKRDVVYESDVESDDRGKRKRGTAKSDGDPMRVLWDGFRGYLESDDGFGESEGLLEPLTPKDVQEYVSGCQDLLTYTKTHLLYDAEFVRRIRSGYLEKEDQRGADRRAAALLRVFLMYLEERQPVLPVVETGTRYSKRGKAPEHKWKRSLFPWIDSYDAYLTSLGMKEHTRKTYSHALRRVLGPCNLFNPTIEDVRALLHRMQPSTSRSSLMRLEEYMRQPARTPLGGAR